MDQTGGHLKLEIKHEDLVMRDTRIYSIYLKDANEVSVQRMPILQGADELIEEAETSDEVALLAILKASHWLLAAYIVDGNQLLVEKTAVAEWHDVDELIRATIERLAA